MGKSYSHMASNYDKIEEAKKDDQAYKRTHFSKEDNDKINEIFDELGDDELNDIKRSFNTIKKKTLH